MQNKYCLPIINPTQDEVLNIIKRAEPNYGFFEVWLDYIEDFEISFVSTLIEKFPDRIVLVLRRQNLEPIKIPAERRLKVLDEVTGKDSLVDLDITCQTDELEYAKDKNLKKIVSFHDYEKTPDTNELEAKIADMQEYNPSIVKISTFCDVPNDALRLLELQQELIETDQKHIVLGMGENGLVTRVFGTLWGNELAFVPEDNDQKSADGQINREEFDKIMKELNARK